MEREMQNQQQMKVDKQVQDNRAQEKKTLK